MLMTTEEDTWLVVHTCSHVAENLAPDSCKVNEKKMSVCCTDITCCFLFSNRITLIPWAVVAVFTSEITLVNQEAGLLIQSKQLLKVSILCIGHQAVLPGQWWHNLYPAPDSRSCEKVVHLEPTVHHARTNQ
jgi:hypothetical protein